MSGLPALSDPRLALLQKQSKRIRKGTTILNDRLKAKKDKSNKVVDRHKASESFRSWQRSMPLKHSLAEIRGIQKCLQRRRESSTLDPETTLRNGVYDGVSLDAMKPDVEKIIQDKNPAVRRQRKVERLKNDKRRIVDFDSSMAKFSDVMERPRGLLGRERAMTLMCPPEFYDQQISSRSEPSVGPGSGRSSSTAQYHLPPIQARRSTIANLSMMQHRPRRMTYDSSSNNSDPTNGPTAGSMGLPLRTKRSMSFAIAQ